MNSTDKMETEDTKPAFWKVVMFSRFMYEYIRYRKTNSPEAKKQFKRNWPTWLLGIEASFVLLFSFVTPAWFLSVAPVWILRLVAYFAASRIIEIAYAYYNDAMDSLGNRVKFHGGIAGRKARISRPDRIRLVIKSYLSLIIDWALVYFALPTFALPTGFQIHTVPDCQAASCAFTSVLDAIYFSGSTITTVGFGDIVPMHIVSKLLSLGEVLSGLLILVLALGTYLAEPNEEPR
jgi:Ion channel